MVYVIASISMCLLIWQLLIGFVEGFVGQRVGSQDFLDFLIVFCIISWLPGKIFCWGSMSTFPNLKYLLRRRFTGPCESKTNNFRDLTLQFVIVWLPGKIFCWGSMSTSPNRKCLLHRLLQGAVYGFWSLSLFDFAVLPHGSRCVALLVSPSFLTVSCFCRCISLWISL